jgi:tetratricopeptide (TPR) repeat protein
MNLAERQDGFRKEFLYIACWAGRRRRIFNEVDQLVMQAIEDFQKDPRFYHGRSLNTFAWLSDEEQRSYCPYTLEEAIADGLKAVMLYKRRQKKDQEMLAANYNNLAYFYAYDRAGSYFDLIKARDCLENLKKCVPKNDWDPLFPEYLHTEAHVEYEEFLAGIADAQSQKERRNLIRKVKFAAEDIRQAVDLYPDKPLYRELKKNIDRALARVR